MPLMNESIRILISISDDAVAGTIIEYLRLRGFAPQLVQRLSTDELWMDASLLIADEARLATYDGMATLPSSLILLGKMLPDPVIKNVPHTEIMALPLRLSDLGKTIARVVTRASISPETIPLEAFLSFFPKERLLRSQNAAAVVELTEKEAALLTTLWKDREKSISRETLLKDIWRYQAGIDTHTLETHIYRLRQKITEAGGDEKMIATTQDGYRFQVLQEAL